MTWNKIIALALALPVTAGAFGMIEANNQTHPGPGGAYGIYQDIRYSSTLPSPVVSSFVCSGASAVEVTAIIDRIDDPKVTGLRQLWGLTNYDTSWVPAVWLPQKFPLVVPELSSFLRFAPGAQGFSIPSFIERYGLPSRYLTGHWNEGQVAAPHGGLPVADETHSLRGPDFLIYDLPSGHAVALYVPKPPATNFITAVITDSKGDLLIPNMVDLLLPQAPKVLPPRKLAAQPDGKIAAPDASGGAATIGAWTMKGRQLIVTTTLKNSDVVLSHDSIWLGGVEYAPDIMVNEHEIVCNPIVGDVRASRGEK
jgi:hypothetical protein